MKFLLVNIVCASLAVLSASIFKFLITSRTNLNSDFKTLFTNLLSILKFFEFWLGLFLFFLSQIVWFYIIASQKLSIAYPLQVGLSLILFSIVAHFIFKEEMNLKQTVALCVIFFGIILLKT